MKPAPGDTPFDFAALAQAQESQAGRHLRAQLWLLGFLALMVASVVALVLYLQNFEIEEEARQNIADAQWLEQSMAFHFRRLEDDLRSQARGHGDQPGGDEAAQQERHGGLLWSEPGVLLARGWLGTASHDGTARIWNPQTNTERSVSVVHETGAPARFGHGPYTPVHLGRGLTNIGNLSDMDDAEITKFEVVPVGPNPSRGEARIAYRTPGGMAPEVEVFDAGGRLVRRIVGTGERGSHVISWDGRNSRGASVGNGLYFFRIRFGDETVTKRVILID